MRAIALLACALPLLPGGAAPLEIVGEATLFAPGIASTDYSEVRLTISPDGRRALWFSRNRPGGAGGYDIWMSRRTATGWGMAEPVSFNTPGRDFDPAFSADGRVVYFCSDRPGGVGGDDLYRVAVTADGFGSVESLGAPNSAGNEFAPMLSPDGSTLLFSSDRPGGAGQHDLYIAARQGAGFAPARPVAGAINTGGDELDATFLSDGTTIVFARAGDFPTDQVDLFHASARDGRYDAGTPLPASVNNGADGKGDSYGPMLDWSRPGSLTFSAQRPGAKGMDLYTVAYRLEQGNR